MKKIFKRKFALIASALTFSFVLTPFLNSPLSAVAAGNLIQNPSLETDTDNNKIPDQWFKGNWGTNNAVFTYPVAGVDGQKAAKVEVTSYADGDAKWYFADVPVAAGKTYNFTDSYISNTDSDLVARYTDSGGNESYLWLAWFGASSNWQTASASIVPPAGTVSVTIFHLIGSVGYLTVDNFSLIDASATPTPTPTPTPILSPTPSPSSTPTPTPAPTPSPAPTPTGSFDKGFVSLTFDDGWRSQRDTAQPILDAAGLKGTFYIITNESIRPVIQNPSLETDADNNGVPDKWFKGKWGTNNAAFTYPVAGIEGAKAAKIDITSYSNGDAKWYFADVAVPPDGTYKFKDQYKSTVATYVVARFTKTGGSVVYTDIGTAAAALNWTKFETEFYVPADTASVTVFHLINKVGSLTIDDAYLDNAYTGYISQNDFLAMQKAGHEISSHTKTHPSLITLNSVQLQDELAGSKSDLLAAGATPVSSLAYPYGDYNDAVKQAAKNAGYLSARSVETGFNTKASDKFALLVQNVDAATTLNDVKSWIDTAIAQKTWLILVFHQVDYSGDRYGTTPEIFKGIVDYLTAQNTPVRTLSDGASLL